MLDMSDHILLTTTIPVKYQRHPKGGATGPAAEAEGETRYKWHVGCTVAEQMEGAGRWHAHTSGEAFQQGLEAIVEDGALGNAARSDAVEQYLLDQAVEVGVVKKLTPKTPRNPNKWGKTLTPWFNEDCHETRKEFVKLRRT